MLSISRRDVMSLSQFVSETLQRTYSISPQRHKKKNQHPGCFSIHLQFSTLLAWPTHFQVLRNLWQCILWSYQLTSFKLTLLLSLNEMNSIPGTGVHFLPTLRTSYSSHNSISTPCTWKFITHNLPSHWLTNLIILNAPNSITLYSHCFRELYRRDNHSNS